MPNGTLLSIGCDVYAVALPATRNSFTELLYEDNFCVFLAIVIIVTTLHQLLACFHPDSKSKALHLKLTTFNNKLISYQTSV